MEFETYKAAEQAIKTEILLQPDFKTKTTYEKLNLSFTLTNILENKNDHSNYDYAHEFFNWILSGKKELSSDLVNINPWVTRFMDTTKLPENFSSSYAWKIMSQLGIVSNELTNNPDSRRGYINILYPADDIIRLSNTTHEYPCTVGLHFFEREKYLHLIVNMRSNNCFSVMPYDVYNFTCLQKYLADKLKLKYGNYHHQMNSAHIYVGDARRIFNQKP